MESATLSDLSQEDTAIEATQKLQNDLGGRVYKLVLTGGPCGGKTTVQARLTTFFENEGWIVYQSPEVATVLIKGGVKFGALSHEEVYAFQENLIRTMQQIEKTYFDLAKSQAATLKKNVIVICDRGIMDATVYMPPEMWERMKSENGWNDANEKAFRYDQVVHLVTAADGALPFYQTENNTARFETPAEAKELDKKVQDAWVGHPYLDVIDNRTDFENKLNKVIRCVCARLGLDVGGRFDKDSVKRKWLCNVLDEDAEFPTSYQNFDITHHYLNTIEDPGIQMRIRKRKLQGPGGKTSYQLTTRQVVNNQRIETRMALSARTYKRLLGKRDVNHYAIEMTRRCFTHENLYFQLDTYHQPHRCKGLVLLTTFHSKKTDISEIGLPPYISVVREVTDDPNYSMARLSLKPVVRSQIFRSNSDCFDECQGGTDDAPNTSILNAHRLSVQNQGTNGNSTVRATSAESSTTNMGSTIVSPTPYFGAISSPETENNDSPGETTPLKRSPNHDAADKNNGRYLSSSLDESSPNQLEARFSNNRNAIIAELNPAASATVTKRYRTPQSPLVVPPLSTSPNITSSNNNEPLTAHDLNSSTSPPIPINGTKKNNSVIP